VLGRIVRRIAPGAIALIIIPRNFLSAFL